MNFLKKSLSLFLSLVMLVVSLCSCNKNKQIDDAVMEYNGHYVTGNMYQYWLSRYKGLFLYSYAGGKDDPSFWNTDVGEGMTAKELFTNIIDENIKKNLICMYLFDNYGLKLPESSKKRIKEEVEQLVYDLGGKDEFNKYAADFGVDTNIIEEIYQIEEKIEFLRNYLYGENGAEKVTRAQKEDYYSENYVRVRHIFFSTTTQYESDENGNTITRTPTDEEINKKKVIASAIHARIEGGESFEDLLLEYTEDDASKTYENGYYFTRLTDYIDEVVEAAFDMDIGEVRIVNSKYGIHIVKRYELDVLAYEDEKNADFFGDFNDLLISEIFQDKLAKYLDDIIINEDKKEKYSILTIKANLQF